MRCAICLALIVAVLTFLPSARQYSSARTLYASGYIPRPKIENIFAPTLLAVATALLCFRPEMGHQVDRSRPTLQNHVR
jgi:hypothetical protein